ncbi:stabilizer of axonemal microtubules 4 [Rhynochetos jubatus]
MVTVPLQPRSSPGDGDHPSAAEVIPRRRGSTDLMNFYATSYTVAYGKPRFRPRLGRHTGTGYVSNNYSAVSSLLCPRGEAEGCWWDTVVPTTAEHFKPPWLPDGRNLLPRHVHQPRSGYPQESPFSCLRTGGVSPQHTRHLHSPPCACRKHGTERLHADPAQPDVLQKTTIRTMEPPHFTRATPRSDSILPALPAPPGQPPNVGITTTDYLPSVHSHGRGTLPMLLENSGFSREVPGPHPAARPHVASPSSPTVPTQGLPVVGHPVPLVSRVTQTSLLGQQGAGRKVGAGTAPSPWDCAPQPTSIPRQLSGYTSNRNQYVTPRLSTTAPAWCWQGPVWTGIQPQRSSGFSTNNHPTGLGGHRQPPLGAAPLG